MSIATPDLMAVLIKVGEAMLMFAPFIIFGAVLATALENILRRPLGQWGGYNLIAIIATFPIGLAAIVGAIFRSTINKPDDVDDSDRNTIIGRAIAHIDDIILPFLLSALLGGIIAVLAPTDLMWSLLSPSAPWRFVLTPLIIGLLRPRGGSELPLVFALITKGLDPAGAAAAIAGAGWLKAVSFRSRAGQLIGAAALGLFINSIPLDIW